VAEPGSKTKLSKRKLDKYLKNPDFAALMKHGRKVADALKMEVNQDTFNPVVTDFYEQVGYLPDAINNYLALLGWSLDDQTEHFDRDDLIKHFTLERVNKAAASFDPKKLWAFQDRHMQRLPLEKKVELVVPYLQRAGLAASPVTECETAKIEHVVCAAGDRIKTAGDILDYNYFFVADDKLVYDEKAVTKSLQKPEAVELLAAFKDQLTTATAFDAAALEQMTHAFVESRGVKIGDIVHSLRAAITGQSVGLGLFDSLAILGKEACLARIDQTLNRTIAA
jgi:glutamyl-tRNA synthetase